VVVTIAITDFLAANGDGGDDAGGSRQADFAGIFAVEYVVGNVLHLLDES